ncbi:LysM peptidoglycan-binding domain-containing protein [Paenibacillus sp. YPG26]|uniref:LysM peptidoglycan-binding domain-containing protein n=1 Tax=Paenibacillus sp. YPG26 TaxID=2878915 RepID=UPI0023EF4695|nr:LysM peptidoglycan-binding domain-containing protein [Paenibacillus sp. YPG26]
MKLHIVQQGDTLYDLSKKYTVPLQKLIDANPQITNPEQLNVGDKVKVPAMSVPVGGGEGVLYKHMVKEGDTLWKLSNAWGIPLQMLISANPQLANPDVLNVGEFVNIPSGGSGGDGLTAPQALSVPGGMKKNTAPISSGGKKNTAPIEAAPLPVLPAPDNFPTPAPLPAPAAENVPTPAPPPVIPPVIEAQPTTPPPIVPQYKIDVKYSEINVPNYIFEFPEQPPAYQPVPEYKQEPINHIPEYKPEPISYIPEYKQEPIKQSPCGCGPSHSENLFHQYPTAAQSAASNHNLYQVSDSFYQPFSAPQPYNPSEQLLTGEYPGLSSAPVYDWPTVQPAMEPCQPMWPYAPMGQPIPYGYHPYSKQPMTNMEYQAHGAWSPIPAQTHQPMYYQPYEVTGLGGYNPALTSMQGQHLGYDYPGEIPNPYGGYEYPAQPSVPQNPLGGFGVPDVGCDNREEDVNPESPENNEAAAKHIKAKREKVTHHTDSKKEGKKARISDTTSSKADREKTRSANKSKEVRQNPWINE